MLRLFATLKWKLRVLATISVLIPVMAYSHSQEIWYNVVSVPPSPNAAALGQYGEVPVNKSTGLADITVPILNLESGGISIPLFLSYHGGGRKVNESSSWVGLGWALKAGGVITRTMRGLPDELGNGFLVGSSKVPNEALIGSDLATVGL